MTKEQEKAILYLEYMNKNIDFNKIGYVYAKEMIETVLNTLEEKDELYHKALSDLAKADRENIQLNRQIDLMADFMYKTGTGRRALSCMFRQNDECNENGCKYCIKQYFERKAEEC